ncbi:uncharacterized protein LOC142352299 [Convolutriloba macropyga]|uniref:uncharacterized protein LOC142352299 n=1 Tax=Convolutriloba macropyga TaxID=536237 RepID=UPI003F51EB32
MADIIGQKEDFVDVYNYKDSSLYYQLYMHKLGPDEKYDMASEYVLNVLSEELFKVWQRKLEKPLQMVDILSGYGADTLLNTRAYNKQDFAEMWGTPGNMYTIHKPLMFPVHTFGCDMSSLALEYGKDAGIYDETATVDLNNMTSENEFLLHQKCREANISTINSLGYLNDGVFEQIVDWFAEGTEPGLFVTAFMYPYDGVQRIKTQKQYLLEKLDFFNSLPLVHRTPTEKEREQLGKEYGMWGAIDIRNLVHD